MRSPAGSPRSRRTPESQASVVEWTLPELVVDRLNACRLQLGLSTVKVMSTSTFVPLEALAEVHPDLEDYSSDSEQEEPGRAARYRLSTVWSSRPRRRRRGSEASSPASTPRRNSFSARDEPSPQASKIGVVIRMVGQEPVSCFETALALPNCQAAFFSPTLQGLGVEASPNVELEEHVTGVRGLVLCEFLLYHPRRRVSLLRRLSRIPSLFIPRASASPPPIQAGSRQPGERTPSPASSPLPWRRGSSAPSPTPAGRAHPTMGAKWPIPGAQDVTVASCGAWIAELLTSSVSQVEDPAFVRRQRRPMVVMLHIFGGAAAAALGAAESGAVARLIPTAELRVQNEQVPAVRFALGMGGALPGDMVRGLSTRDGVSSTHPLNVCPDESVACVGLVADGAAFTPGSECSVSMRVQLPGEGEARSLSWSFAMRPPIEWEVSSRVSADRPFACPALAVANASIDDALVLRHNSSSLAASPKERSRRRSTWGSPSTRIVISNATDAVVEPVLGLNLGRALLTRALHLGMRDGGLPGPSGGGVLHLCVARAECDVEAEPAAMVMGRLGVPLVRVQASSSALADPFTCFVVSVTPAAGCLSCDRHTLTCTVSLFDDDARRAAHSSADPDMLDHNYRLATSRGIAVQPGEPSMFVLRCCQLPRQEGTERCDLILHLSLAAIADAATNKLAPLSAFSTSTFGLSLSVHLVSLCPSPAAQVPLAVTELPRPHTSAPWTQVAHCTGEWSMTAVCWTSWAIHVKPRRAGDETPPAPISLLLQVQTLDVAIDAAIPPLRLFRERNARGQFIEVCAWSCRSSTRGTFLLVELSPKHSPYWLSPTFPDWLKKDEGSLRLRVLAPTAAHSHQVEVYRHAMYSS